MYLVWLGRRRAALAQRFPVITRHQRLDGVHDGDVPMQVHGCGARHDLRERLGLLHHAPVQLLHLKVAALSYQIVK